MASLRLGPLTGYFITDRQKVLAVMRILRISVGVPADFGVVGDAKRVLSTLLSKLGAGPANQTWREQVARSRAIGKIDLPRSLLKARPASPCFGRWRGMGFSLGASIAAKLARPDAQVFCLIGDGGFSMLMGKVRILC